MLCWKASEAQFVVDRRLAGGSVCVCTAFPGELIHQRVLTVGPPNMQKGGSCMGADGLWEGFANGNGQRWFMKGLANSRVCDGQKWVLLEGACYVCKERASATTRVTDILDNYS